MFSCAMILLIPTISSSEINLVREEIENNDIEFKDKLIIYKFMIGLIYDLSYFENNVDNISSKGYEFKCIFLMEIEIHNFGIPFFDIKRNGESMSLLEKTYEYDDMIVETYYKGYIGKKFVCALKVVKADF